MSSLQSSRAHIVSHLDMMSPTKSWVSRARPRPLLWLYLLAALPAVTDLMETGALPTTQRSWIAEIVMGIVIALLVHYVRRAHRTVLALAATDQLTGLHNRRVFLESTAASCARARRTRQPLSLVYIDLDNFKQINDRRGHAEGDRVLQQIAMAIRESLRLRVDRGFRLGGDEFAILLPGSSAVQSIGVLRRLRDHCVQADRIWLEGVLDISYGIVEYDLGESAEAFVHRADEAMYRAKKLRKEVCCEMLALQ